MNNKIQLLSVKSAPRMEKAALSFLARGAASILPRLNNLAARRDLVGGLAAPIPKLIGGLQRTYGLGQQGVAAVRQGLGSSMDDLLKNPLYQRGAKNISAGKNLREQSAYLTGIKAPNPWQYRLGRGIGGFTLGAPLAVAPFTAAEYAGAASADSNKVKDYAKNRAYERVEDRLGQFQALPFLERMKAIYNPEGFTQQLDMPEATNLHSSIQAGTFGNSPGLLKFLSSFNPFLGSPSDVINQKVRGEMFNSLNAKEAGEKRAMQLLKGLGTGLGKAWRAGRAAKPRFKPKKNTSILQSVLQRGAYNTAKSPLKALGAAAPAAIIPYALKSNYDAGKNNVYDAAANDAVGMADLGLMEQFNQPGFMGGLGRAGMAIAPGMGSDMILKQIRQSMFPEVSNTVR